jgi:hypothetical protein
MAITNKKLRQAVNMVNTIHDTSGLYALQQSNIKYLDAIFLKDEQLQVLSTYDIKQFPQSHIQQFCLSRGIYCLPTTELIEFLKQEIGKQRMGNIAIEIGAGNGAISRELNIIATDSYMHNDLNVQVHYKRSKQPITKYGNNIHKLDAEQAIKKFTPKTVIGSFITHKFKEERRFEAGNMYGVEEEAIIQVGTKYIFIGNEETHKEKYVKKLFPDYKQHKFDFLICKVIDQKKNVIWIWNA